VQELGRTAVRWCCLAAQAVPVLQAQMQPDLSSVSMAICSASLMALHMLSCLVPGALAAVLRLLRLVLVRAPSVPDDAAPCNDLAHC